MENKFDGDIGVLKRKHIRDNGLVYIGKEANNIEDQPLDVTKPQSFINMGEIKEWLKNNFKFSLWEWLYNSIPPNNHQRQYR